MNKKPKAAAAIAETEAPKEELTFAEKAEDVVEDAVDTVKAVATVVGEKVVDFIKDLVEPDTEAAATVETTTEEETPATEEPTKEA